MRRKPSSQNNGGYNNQNRGKPRYQGSGGGDHRSGGGHHHNNGGRPRKNYAASREKYLAQARDALASGDRVLAENYYQHADHCYRMMVEEGYNTRNSAPVQQAGDATQPQSEQQADQQTDQQGDQQMEANIPENTNQLPAFITANYEPAGAKPVDPASIQNWEERDA